MRFERVINGILKYMDAEIYGGMNPWQEMLSRIAVARVVKNSEKIKDVLANNAFVKTFAIIDDEGNVDIEGLLHDIKEQIERKGKLSVTIPMIGNYSFVPSDVDKLYQFITEG